MTDPRYPDGLRVLIVDEADQALPLVLLLQKAGHQTAVAHDGEAALEKARAFSPQAALLGLGLAGKNGGGVAEQIRELRLRPPPLLVALTHDGEDAGLPAAAGCDLQLTRPAGPAAILDALDRYLRLCTLIAD